MMEGLTIYRAIVRAAELRSAHSEPNQQCRALQEGVPHGEEGGDETSAEMSSYSYLTKHAPPPAILSAFRPREGRMGLGRSGAGYSGGPQLFWCRLDLL